MPGKVFLASPGYFFSLKSFFLLKKPKLFTRYASKNMAALALDK